jgi:hypothetical protein
MLAATAWLLSYATASLTHLMYFAAIPVSSFHYQSHGNLLPRYQAKEVTTCFEIRCVPFNLMATVETAVGGKRTPAAEEIEKFEPCVPGTITFDARDKQSSP